MDELLTPEVIGFSDEELKTLLDEINSKYGYDFKDYSEASFKRQIRRYMKRRNYDSFKKLSDDLLNSKDLFETLVEEITVNTTEMFRDPQFYNAVRQKIFPTLATYPEIKIWHAGCSTGEEVYSMAILLEEAGLLHKSFLYGTDINRKNLILAKKGIYSNQYKLKGSEYYLRSGGKYDLSNYFNINEKHFTISDNLKRSIAFFEHNLITDKSFNEFNMIICRNVLIYFNNKLQNSVLNLFDESLIILGFLGLGINETLSTTDFQTKFRVFDWESKLYRKIF